MQWVVLGAEGKTGFESSIEELTLTLLGNFSTVEQLSNCWTCQKSSKIASLVQKMSIYPKSGRAAAPRPPPLASTKTTPMSFIDIWGGGIVSAGYVLGSVPKRIFIGGLLSASFQPNALR